MVKQTRLPCSIHLFEGVDVEKTDIYYLRFKVFENRPLRIGLQNVTYTAVYIVGHDRI